MDDKKLDELNRIIEEMLKPLCADAGIEIHEVKGTHNTVDFNITIIGRDKEKL